MIAAEDAYDDAPSSEDDSFEVRSVWYVEVNVRLLLLVGSLTCMKINVCFPVNRFSRFLNLFSLALHFVSCCLWYYSGIMSMICYLISDESLP